MDIHTCIHTRIHSSRIFIPGKPRNLEKHQNSVPLKMQDRSTFISIKLWTKCGNCRSTPQWVTENWGSISDPKKTDEAIRDTFGLFLPFPTMKSASRKKEERCTNICLILCSQNPLLVCVFVCSFLRQDITPVSQAFPVCNFCCFLLSSYRRFYLLSIEF